MTTNPFCRDYVWSGEFSHESVASGFEEVLAFMRMVEIANTADFLPEGIDCSGGLCSQMRFELVECHFDRVVMMTLESGFLMRLGTH